MVCLQPWPLSRLRHISGFCAAGCGGVSAGEGRSSGGVNVVGCGVGPCGTVDESIPKRAGCGRIAGRLKNGGLVVVLIYSGGCYACRSMDTEDAAGVGAGSVAISRLAWQPAAPAINLRPEPPMYWFSRA